MHQQTPNSTLSIFFLPLLFLSSTHLASYHSSTPALQLISSTTHHNSIKIKSKTRRRNMARTIPSATTHTLLLFLTTALILLISTSLLPITNATSIAGHGQSMVGAWVEILEPQALKGQRLPLQLSQFSIIPPQGVGLTAYVSLMDPIIGCSDSSGTIRSTPSTLKTAPPLSTLPHTLQYRDTIILVERGDCQFIEKANVAEQLGAVGFLLSNVVDTVLPVPIASTDGSPPARYLPVVGGAILGRDGNFLKALLSRGVPVRVTIMPDASPRPL
jgi:hypothetical protein